MSEYVYTVKETATSKGTKATAAGHRYKSGLLELFKKRAGDGRLYGWLIGFHNFYSFTRTLKK